MSFWQWLAHKLFRRQYVIFLHELNKPKVHRAWKVGGVYRIQETSISTFYLTRDTMAPDTVQLQNFAAAYLATHRANVNVGMEIPIAWRWAGLTEEVTAHTAMMPSGDDFLPRITTQVEMPEKLTPGAVVHAA